MTDYAQTLGVEKAAEAIKTRLAGTSYHTDEETKCLIWTGTTSDGGYGRVSLVGSDGATKDFKLHRVAYVAHYGYDIVQGGASHLCSNSACFNWAHIVDETPKANNSRKGCNGDF